MRRIIAIVDPDTEYSEKLAAFLNSHDMGGIRCTTFADVDSFRAHIRENECDVQVVLAPEDAMLRFHDDEISGVQVLMSEDGLARTQGIPFVFKYAKADSIRREIMKVYSDNTSEKLVRLSDKKSHVTGIYSPLGRSGKTSFALCLAMSLSASDSDVNTNTLFIPLDEYSGVFKYIAAEARYDLSDIIFSYSKGNYSWSRLSQAIYRFGPVNYIPPVRYAEDLLQLTSLQMCELIMKMCGESGCETVVIDIGSFARRGTDIFELCDEVYMPVDDNELSGCKVEEFIESLECGGHRDIANKIVKLHLPYDSRFEKVLTREEDYMSGGLYEYAGSLQGNKEETK